MRFLELRLMAFGPFTGLTLDFSEPSPGLHLLYGRNEAGKSTALRAIAGLLYGIPKATRDAHLHKMSDLRIGARLAAEDGAVLDVVRRKGMSNTLLDRHGLPMNEALLRRFLGGVSSDIFETTFGINHETLREGGQALLAGKGSVSESLFGAGLGGDVHRVLASLRAEADAIFAPRASKPPLNEALSAFADAKKRIVEQSLSGDARRAQEQALEEARLERDACERDRAEQATRLRRLTRLQRLLPLVAKRDHLRARRAALGPVLLLPEEAPRERHEALRTAADAALGLERRAEEIAALEEKRATLPVAESLVEREDRVEVIQQRYGAYVTGQEELPRVVAELSRIEEEARAVLRKIGRDEPLEQIRRVNVLVQARIRKLALQPARFEEKVLSIQRELATIEADVAAAKATLAALGPAPDVAPLRAVVARVLPAGDLEGQLRDVSAEVERLAEAARTKLAGLGLWSGPLAEVAALPVPVPDTAERFEREWSALLRRRERLEERRSAAAEQLAQLERAIDAVQRAGAVPTEADLEAARGARAEAWQRIRSAAARERTDALLDPFERTMLDADVIADRLRREAERVTRLSSLLADRAATSAELARLEQEEKALDADTRAFQDAWFAAWQPAGVTPLSPAEMRGWLTRHATVVAAVDALRAAESEAKRLARRIGDARGALFDGLRAAGAEVPPEDTSLSALLTCASAHLSALEDAERVRREAERKIGERQKVADRLARERKEAEDALAAWRGEWGRAVAPIGLSADASPEEAIALLDALAELYRLVDAADQARRRADALRRDAEAFGQEVDRLVRAHAPDLVGQPLEQAAAALVKRFREGREAQAARKQLDEQLEGLRRQRAELLAVKSHAEAKLEALKRAAQVDSLDALVEAENRSAEARAIDAELASVEAQIVDQGEGAPLETLVAEAAATDPDTLPVEIERAEEARRALEDRLRRIDQSIGGLQEGLKTIDGAPGAADVADEAQEHLARVRAHAERYVRTRLAAVILARTIERYREQNQGPIFRRATELFRRLTLGSFAALRTGFGDRDEPVIRCVRPDGREVEIEGLSDGTRDQLYLALRLATLDLYATEDPMPLVLDDILIHFDDERSRAALEILGELSERRQILFFTHHTRVRDLAQEAVAAKRLRIHELVSRPTPMEVNGPERGTLPHDDTTAA